MSKATLSSPINEERDIDGGGRHLVEDHHDLGSGVLAMMSARFGETLIREGAL